MNDRVTDSSDVLSTAQLAALSDDSLLVTSSKAILQRGRSYARSGAVEQVTRQASGKTPALHATVQGSEPYATEVWIRDGAVGGSCDCMHAQDGWFCKHQVALALVWRERSGGEGHVPVVDAEPPSTVRASARRVPTREDRGLALKKFLHAQPMATLVDRLLELAERDPDIDRELQQWRQLSAAPQGATALTALVTDIMSPGSDFISWRESKGYVHRAQAVLQVLSLARSRDATFAAALCLHAMRQGWAVLLQSDDSSGDIGGLIQSIGDEWVGALKQAGPQPAAFGETYLQLLLDDPFGCFDTAEAEIALGAAALARFRKVLATRWREAQDGVLAERAEQATWLAQAAATKRKTPCRERNQELSRRLGSLARMHLRQLENAGNLDGALAVMREDLSEAATYHAITEFLERHGRQREAFANVEQGCKAFPDDTRLQDDLLRCLDRDGGVAEAFHLRHRRFARSPSVERYHEVLAAGRRGGRNAQDLRAELQARLIALEDEALAEAGARPLLRWRGQAPQPVQRNVTLRVSILCSEDRQEDALPLVQPPAHCADGVLVQLARRLGPKHGARRIELLLRVFDNEMANSKTPYRRELALVEEIARLLEPAARAAWLQQLRLAYKAKRNFIRDLPTADLPPEARG